jgi:hypothetical protein
MEEAMNTLAKLAPLAVGLAIFAAIVAFMLQRQMALGTWLLAAFLLGHGLVHVMFAAPTPAPAAATTGGMEYPFDVAKSWLVNDRFIALSTARVLVFGLVAVTVVGYLLAAMSTVGFVVPQSLWPSLVIASTAASAALMLIGLSPGLGLGIAIDLVLFLVVVSAAWSPGRMSAV